MQDDHGSVGISPAEKPSPSLANEPATPSEEVPESAWYATADQVSAAQGRVKKAVWSSTKEKAETVCVDRRDLRLVLHHASLTELSDEIVGMLRDSARAVTGGNMTFADMDLHLLEFLAFTAVRAGLTDGLHPSMAVKAVAACAAHRFAAEEGVATTPTADGEASNSGEADGGRPNPNDTGADQ